MGGVVSDVVGGVGDIVGGAVDTVKDVASSDLGKAALLAAGAYYGAPYLMGGEAAATGGGILEGLGTATGADLAAAYDMGAVGAAGAGGFTPVAAAPSLLGSAVNWAKENPLSAAGLGLTAASALGGGLGNKPTSSTTTTAIDPEMKAAYLRNLEEARATAAGLGEKQLADFTAQYGTAEKQLESLGLGGLGQTTTNEAARLAMQEAGFTPQQIAAASAGETNLALSQGYTPQQIAAAQANRANIANVTGQLGSQFMSAYQNPYEQQVVQGALGDIERQRRISQQAQQARASAARAFGGSRQAVAEALANEDYTRQAANTAAQLRQQGFTTAAGLGQTDAARMLQAQLANQGVDVTLEQANTQLRQQAALANQGAFNQAAQFGAGSANQAALANAAARNQMAQYNAQLAQQAALANQSAFAQGAGIRQGAIGQLGALGAQQQNLGIAGAQAVMNAQQQRQALAQARLDASRNLALERLGISQSALGLQPANLGGTSTSPIYRNTSASALGGALSGGMLGRMIGGTANPEYAGYGAGLGGLLGLLG